MAKKAAVAPRWLSALDNLQAFIAEHPEICIQRSSVVIPAAVRTEFYRLFDGARLAVVTELTAGFMPRAEELAGRYRDVDDTLTSTLGLEGVTVPNPAGWFLLDPRSGLSRELFDPLFDLLKRKIDGGAFERSSLQLVTAGLEKLYQRAYEIRLALSLALSLGAESAYRVVLRRPSEHREWTIIKSGKSDEAVPPPVPASAISFEHLPEHLFTVPDFIVRAGSGRYYSFIAGLNNAIATAINASADREWLDYEGPLFSDSGPLLVFAGSSLDELKLVADVSRICRPDVVVQTAGPDVSHDAACLERAGYWQDMLKPRRGCFAMLNEPSAVLPVSPAGVGVLGAGFGTEMLAGIVAAIEGRED